MGNNWGWVRFTVFKQNIFSFIELYLKQKNTWVQYYNTCIIPEYIIPKYIITEYIIPEYIIPEYIIPEYIIPEYLNI